MHNQQCVSILLYCILFCVYFWWHSLWAVKTPYRGVLEIPQQTAISKALSLFWRQRSLLTSQMSFKFFLRKTNSSWIPYNADILCAICICFPRMKGGTEPHTYVYVGATMDDDMGFMQFGRTDRPNASEMKSEQQQTISLRWKRNAIQYKFIIYFHMFFLMWECKKFVICIITFYSIINLFGL